MFTDARDVAHGTEMTADLCIVGAGAAGITLARALASSTRRVVVLESGFVEPHAPTQALFDGAALGIPYFPLGDAGTRTRQYGGSTNRWNGECRPLTAIDFERREWMPGSGWPFDAESLRPYYDRAQGVCEVGPFAYTVDDESLDGAVEPTIIQYSRPTRFGVAAYDDLARAENTTVLLGANVVDLELTDSGRAVSCVHVATLAGDRFAVRAWTVVLATGGIENARILLASDSVARGGVGNGHDLVGRYFMEHLYLDDAAHIAVCRHARARFTKEHRSGTHRVRFALTLSEAVQREEHLPATTFVITGTPAPTGGARRARHVVQRLTGSVRSHVVLPVKHVQEQVPNPASRVVLSTERDRLGSRRADLDWRTSSVDRQAAARSHTILDRAVRAAGIGRVVDSRLTDGIDWPADLRGARHHMGTTRMHPDPKCGVVDADSRVHGVANLYVAGSSVFPTSGSANPTLTIVALTLRLADHLAKTRS